MSHLLDSLLTEDQRQQAKAADAAARVAHYQQMAAEAIIHAAGQRNAWSAYQHRGDASSSRVCTLRMQPGTCVVRYAEIDRDDSGPVYSVDAIQLAGGVWLAGEALDLLAQQAIDLALIAELRRIADEERVHGY